MGRCDELTLELQMIMQEEKKDDDENEDIPDLSEDITDPSLDTIREREKEKNSKRIRRRRSGGIGDMSGD